MQDTTVIELRQYTLHPGQRDVLIELFEREFIEAQRAVGIDLIGQFRDMDDADRFIWLRGFADMAARGRALAAFYGGPVWQAHRDAANRTMVDSDNVLLLRPASGFSLPQRAEPCVGLVLATICPFDAPVSADFIEFFERSCKPAMANAGTPVLASLVTENSANNFPRLPVREGEQVFVWFSAARDRACAERCIGATRGLQSWLGGPPRRLRLEPSAHSRLQPLGAMQ